MIMPVNPTLYCPIRGQLKVQAKTKDGLRFSEEKRRIDCIKYLLGKGYPKENFQVETTIFRFGNQGRNSFRPDITIYDIPALDVKNLEIGKLREHILISCEIKRDNKDADEAKETQAKAALGFLPSLDALGIYWDDLEQRVFLKKLLKNNIEVVEAPITYLPNYGHGVSFEHIRYNDLKKPQNLVSLFNKLENDLHHFCSDLSTRYEIILQLLIVKIFDEKEHCLSNGEMTIQDFTMYEMRDEDVVQNMETALENALNIYQRYLPRKIPNKLSIHADALRLLTKHLAPVNLLESSAEVMQEFFMYFAKELYKWNLAQYFTPYEVIDFIVRITNPKFGDTIKDPACGSADFLIGAHRLSDTKVGDNLWGSDLSANAVQISVLNMVLNGDGKSNIKEEDSLENVERDEDKFSIMLCNPPFGQKIKEKRVHILNKFNLGKNLKEQETGILFLELCIRQAKPGKRIAIILPNGYLGNRSAKYREMRKWMLCNAKLVCVVGFPRFTFKKSGADVSASVIILEKRIKPIENPEKSEDYPVYFNLLNKVGWDIGNKKAEKIFRQNPQDGSILLDEENNEPVLNADFKDVLNDLYASPVVDAFPWIVKGISNTGIKDGWSIPFSEVVKSDDYIIDAKRYCRKYIELINNIREHEHFNLLDVFDVLPQRGFKLNKSSVYRYVEIGDIHLSSYDFQEMRGWQLPSRATHQAQPGDIFIGSIWGSVGKWFIAGGETAVGNVLVTNGCYRLRLKDDKKNLLPDIILGLSSEFYRVQMRALATGSDGLAEISESDLGKVLLPKLTDVKLRRELEHYAEQLLEKTFSNSMTLAQALNTILPDLSIPKRESQFAQV